MLMVKKTPFLMYVTVVLFCHCKRYIMAIPWYYSLKHLSVSHESYRFDDYFPEQFIFFLPSIGYAVVTTILYFPVNHVELWTGFVWLMIRTLNMVQPSAIIFCKRKVLCFGVSFLLVILYVALQ